MRYATKYVVLVATTALLGCEFHAGAEAGPQSPSAAAPAPAPAAPAPAPNNGGAVSATATPVPAPAAPPLRQITVTGAQAAGIGGVQVPTATRDNGFGSGDASPDALKGVVYFIPESSTKIPDFSQLKPAGVLYAKQLNISPRDFKEGFPGIDTRFEWFGIRYDGTFKVAKDDNYAFRIISDDGANVYVDDVKQLDNDGLHGPRGFAKEFHLTAGEHRLRVDYFQGPRFSIALQLFVSSISMKEQLWSSAF